MTKQGSSGDALFRMPARTVLINLTGDFEGGWIRCVRRISLEDLMRLEQASDFQEQEEQVRWFARTLIKEWNLADEEGNVLAAGEASFMGALPPDLCIQILQGYVEAVRQVPAPLGEPSTDGSPSADSMTTASE